MRNFKISIVNFANVTLYEETIKALTATNALIIALKDVNVEDGDKVLIEEM